MKNIALAFSGGGFRAAAFSLGSLSYLNRLRYQGSNLLHNVKFISSTSGGSITNLLYSAGVYEGEDFESFYQNESANITGQDLIGAAMNNLNNVHTAWKGRPDKNVNLINAFSLEYDKMLKGREFSMFSDRSRNPHLEEVCINSTEFTNGYAFRFQSQKTDNPLPHENGLVGNKYIHYPANDISTAGKIRLGDILASSSCFPSGFEPMIFPRDYTTGTLTRQELIQNLIFKTNAYTLPPNHYNSTDLLKDKKFRQEPQFGIMDGGVADNQAIDAMSLAHARRLKDKRPGFDLFIACDVTSYFMDGYTLPVPSGKWYYKIPFNIARLFIILVFISIAAWCPFALVKFWNDWHWWSIASVVVSAVFFIPGLMWVVGKISSIFSKKKSSGAWAVVFNKYKSTFTRMSLGTIRYLLLTRAKSIFILANDIYLKQIRRMYYNKIYGDPNFTGRIIHNAIYDLSRVNFPSEAAMSSTPPPPTTDEGDTAISASPARPSEEMITVAEKARSMATTLWFDPNHEKENMKNCIIATGQFTLCYKLLKHVINLEEKDDDMQQLGKQLAEDYERFRKDPFWMMGSE